MNHRAVITGDRVLAPPAGAASPQHTPRLASFLVRGPSLGRLLVHHQPSRRPFLRQVGTISQRFDFIGIDAALERLGRHPPANVRRPFTVLNFDDGRREFLDVMDDLVALDVPACLYIVTDWLDRPGYLRTSELSLVSATFDIGSHTVAHARLADLDEDRLTHALQDSKHRLEDLIGKPVVHLAAPFGGPGSFGAAAVHRAASVGYTSFRTTFRGWNAPDGPGLAGMRILRADVLEDTYRWLRLRATLEGLVDWRVGRRLGVALTSWQGKPG